MHLASSEQWLSEKKAHYSSCCFGILPPRSFGLACWAFGQGHLPLILICVGKRFYIKTFRLSIPAHSVHVPVFVGSYFHIMFSSSSHIVGDGRWWHDRGSGAREVKRDVEGIRDLTPLYFSQFVWLSPKLFASLIFSQTFWSGLFLYQRMSQFKLQVFIV